MKTTGNNTQSGNDSTRPSDNSKLSWIGLMLTTTLCGLALSGLSSAAQAQTNGREAIMDKSHWVQIPGELIRPDCVHAVPNGATVEVGSDGQPTGDVTLKGVLIAHYDACPEQPIITRHSGSQSAGQGGVGNESLAHTPGTGNGWVEASVWNLPLSAKDNIDYMAGTWIVPSYPSESGATIFLFNGIEPKAENWIMQPVLQYGVSAAGGGNYWTIASWLVGPSSAYVSPLEITYPGDSIFGYTEMTATSGSTKYWQIEAKDQTTGYYSWLDVHTSGQHWTWGLAAVLEAYSVTSCSQFPANGRATFYNSTVDHGFPYYDVESGNGWVGYIYNYGGPSCHFTVIASEESTLDF